MKKRVRMNALIIKIKLENGMTETLKTQFKSKSSQGGCNLPNEKNFKKAYKKLMDKWRSSQQPGNKISNIITHIIHNRKSSDGGCKYCKLSTLGGNTFCGCSYAFGCGSCLKNN
jgi:hypothetical protein